MAQAGSIDQVLQSGYQQLGYQFPLRAYSRDQAGAICRRFVTHYEQRRELLELRLPRERVAFLIENHLYLRWVCDIITNPHVLDAVESVLGPDILVWSSQWFPKFSRDKSFVSWHQDAAYWGLSPPRVVTAWIALTASRRANGCVCVIPGTHRGDLLPQRDTYADANMLSRGQEIAVDVDTTRAVALELEAGEFSLHHIGIVHGSGPNESDQPRIGLAIRYISPEVVQRGRERDMVMLVRGDDRHGHFDIVQPPERDLAYGASPVHAESLARKRRNLMPADTKEPGG